MSTSLRLAARLAAATLLALPALSALAASGEDVFNQNCAMCHRRGVAGAPKFGSKEEWAPRIATGRDALMHSLLNGKNAMPPRGGNAKLSDADAGAALDYMIEAAK